MDNYEMSNLLASLICWAFFFILIGGGVYGFITNAEPLKLPAILQDLKDDKIELGYIDDVVPPPLPQSVNMEVVDEDELSQLKKQVEILKLKKQLEQLRDECSSPETGSKKKLMQDCTDALVSLGEKKVDATNKVKHIFHHCPDLKTVDEFLNKAFQS